MPINQDIRIKYASRSISNVVFYIPFSYYYVVRLGTVPKLLSWILIYLFPVSYYAFLTYNGAIYLFIINMLLILSSTFSLYELGYILNDTITTQREQNPTIRLYPQNLHHYERYQWYIIFCRIVYSISTIICLLFVNNTPIANIQPQHLTYTILSIVSSFPIFLLYNHWRSYHNVLLYPVLVFSRYHPFALLYEINWIIILFLFISFPMINMIERFSMPRYRFSIIRTIIPNEDTKSLFRVVYYTIILVISSILHLLGIISLKLIIPIIVLFIYRLLLYFITKNYHPQNYLNG